MKHLDDRRRCPHCLAELNERPYVMARSAAVNVLPWSTVAWIVAAALALLLLAG